MYRSLSAFAFCLSVFLLGASPAFSQGLSHDPAALEPNPQQLNNNELRERWKSILNENAVSIVSGNLNGAYLTIAYDISAVLDYGNDLRVLPVVGKGAVQNMRDIMFLRGVDMGLINLVALDHFEKNGRLGTNLASQLAYITALFQDELHVLARPEIKTFRDLDGKRVNFSDKGSGAQLSSRGIFEALGMNVKEFNMGQGDAIEMMKKGELEATLCTCLKPLGPHQKVSKELGFRLVPVPYDKTFQKLYLPAVFTHEDYPNLIAQGETVETIAVQTLLAVYNWTPSHPRYKKIEKFVNAFFDNFDKFMTPPRHPRWKSVNLAANVQGLPRFPAAQKWLDANQNKAAAVDTSDARIRTAFETFLTESSTGATPSSLNPEKRDALYAEFSKWWKTKQKGTAQ